MGGAKLRGTLDYGMDAPFLIYFSNKLVGGLDGKI